MSEFFYWGLFFPHNLKKMTLFVYLALILQYLFTFAVRGVYGHISNSQIGMLYIITMYTIYVLFLEILNKQGNEISCACNSIFTTVCLYNYIENYHLCTLRQFMIIMAIYTYIVYRLYLVKREMFYFQSYFYFGVFQFLFCHAIFLASQS